MMATNNYETRHSGAGDAGVWAVPNDLSRLDEMDEFEVEEGDVDPRGYALLGRNGNQIGTIENLLASPTTMKAHFAIVDTGGWLSGKKYLIPVRQLQFRDGEAHTLLSEEQFKAAPEWKDDDHDYQSHLNYWRAFATGAGDAGMATAQTGTADREVRVPVVEETAEIRRGVEQIGAVTLRKRTVTSTEHVSTPVSRTRVSVETHDVPAGESRALTDAEATTLRDGETLRVPIVEENVEIVKEPRVTKEVVISTDTETDHVEKDVNLRREVVDVEREGDLEDETDEVLERPGTHRV